MLLLTDGFPRTDPRHHLNNRATSSSSSSSSSQYESERLYSSVSMIDLPDELSREPSPQIYSEKCLEPIQFHRTRGGNIRFSSNKCIAERNSNYYSQGYVFSQRPLNIGEKLVLQVLKTDQLYSGSLAFGLTSCDPSYMNLADLPDDSHQLIDRPEYWVVIKDVANSPMAGDEIAFCITESGEVQMTKNRQRPITLMHVDTSQRLWGFFDLFGCTLKVRLLGTQPSSHVSRSSLALVPVGRLSGVHSNSLHNMHKAHQSTYPVSSGNKRSSLCQRPIVGASCKGASSEPKRVNVDRCQQNNALNSSLYQAVEPKMKSSSSNSGTVYRLDGTHLQATNRFLFHPSGSLNSIGNDCLVCYEQPINSVLYMCGHVCMCYDCSVKQWRTSGHCPICRAPIRDVIRTYWA